MWALSSGCVTSWLSLFLAAQVLSSCFFMAHSQATTNVTISIELLPEHPEVGNSVTMIPEKTTRDVTSCLWLKSFGGEYDEIFVHKIKPDNKVTNGDGYDGRQMLRENCALRITELDVEDMALYRIIKNTTGETEIGEAFLRILQDRKANTPSPDADPAKPEEEILTVGTMAGIIIGCLVGSVLIVSLLTYQTTKQQERIPGDGRSPPMPSKPGSQQRLSIHNLGPLPTPM